MLGMYWLRTERGEWPVLVVESLADQVGGVAGWVVIMATTRESWRDSRIAARLTGSWCVVEWRKLSRGERLPDRRKGQHPCIERGVAPCSTAGPQRYKHAELVTAYATRPARVQKLS